MFSFVAFYLLVALYTISSKLKGDLDTILNPHRKRKCATITFFYPFFFWRADIGVSINQKFNALLGSM